MSYKQQIVLYVDASSTVGKLVDSAGQPLRGGVPAIVRDMEALLCIRLMKGEAVSYPTEELQGITTWDVAYYDDWDDNTGPVLVADNNDIVLITENPIYAELQVPLTQTNTNELIAKLNGASDVTLGVEINGYAAGNTKPVFVLQFDLPVRNKRKGDGSLPTNADVQQYYLASQVDALLTSKIDKDLSTYPTATLSGSARLPIDTGTAQKATLDEVVTYLGTSRYPDHEFTSADLDNGVLTIPGIVTISQIVDEDGETVQLAKWKYLADTTEIDVSSYTVNGTWRVKFAGGQTTEVRTDVVTERSFNCLLNNDQTVSIDEAGVGGVDIKELVGYCTSTKIKLKVKSASTTITGNAYIAPVINGTIGTYAAYPVTLGWTTIEIPCVASNSVIGIARDASNANDTLDDAGAVVSLLIQNPAEVL